MFSSRQQCTSCPPGAKLTRSVLPVYKAWSINYHPILCYIFLTTSFQPIITTFTPISFIYGQKKSHLYQIIPNFWVKKSSNYELFWLTVEINGNICWWVITEWYKSKFSEDTVLKLFQLKYKLSTNSILHLLNNFIPTHYH